MFIIFTYIQNNKQVSYYRCNKKKDRSSSILSIYIFSVVRDTANDIYTHVTQFIDKMQIIYWTQNDDEW